VFVELDIFEYIVGYWILFWERFASSLGDESTYLFQTYSIMLNGYLLHEFMLGLDSIQKKCNDINEHD